MSTGANCNFREKEKGKWFYSIQSYPYGATEDHETHGPFATFEDAKKHLDRHYANPGGYGITALPGCKHDLREALDKWQTCGGAYTHSCRRCGEFFTATQAAA